MRNHPDSDSPQDREIARRFAGMREADARQAPPVPVAQDLARRPPLVVERRYSPVASRLAAGVVLALVVGLTAYHFWCVRLVKTFAADANTRGHKWYRWFNEVPTVALIAVVLLAVLKPF